MSESAKEYLSIRDQRMIISMYHSRDLIAVAEKFSLSKSAISKRFDKIQLSVGPLFEFTRKGVIVLAHTHRIVTELEKSISHAEKAMAMTNGEWSTENRIRVNLAIIDQLEAPIIKHLHERLQNPEKIQIQLSHTAPYIIDDRAQNLFEMTRLLEKGDLDIVVCLDFSKTGVRSENSHIPRITGVLSRDLDHQHNVCMINKNTPASDPMTEKQFANFKRIAQIPDYVDVNSDISLVVTQLSTAAEMIQYDKNLLCMPIRIVADYYSRLYNLKVVTPPENQQVSLSIKMLWSQSTDKNLACSEVRSALIRCFAD